MTNPMTQFHNNPQRPLVVSNLNMDNPKEGLEELSSQTWLIRLINELEDRYLPDNSTVVKCLGQGGYRFRVAGAASVEFKPFPHLTVPIRTYTDKSLRTHFATYLQRLPQSRRWRAVIFEELVRAIYAKEWVLEELNLCNERPLAVLYRTVSGVDYRIDVWM